jgi:hypothetical protein
MTEPDTTPTPPAVTGPGSDRPTWWSTANLLTPRATAIAGFAFAVFSMLGQGSWSITLTALFWGNHYAVGSVTDVMTAWGVGCLVMAGIGALLASRTLRAGTDGWEGHLARAAVIVAAVGAVLGVLTIIGSLVHQG